MVIMLLPKMITQNLIPWIKNKWNQSKVGPNPEWYEREYAKVWHSIISCCYYVGENYTFTQYSYIYTS